MSATPDLNALLPMSAGLAFETMLIASLYIATAAGVLIAARRRRLLGALGGIAVFGVLAAFLVLGGPLTTLRGYAACVDRDSPRCNLG